MGITFFTKPPTKEKKKKTPLLCRLGLHNWYNAQGGLLGDSEVTVYDVISNWLDREKYIAREISQREIIFRMMPYLKESPYKNKRNKICIRCGKHDNQIQKVLDKVEEAYENVK